MWTSLDKTNLLKLTLTLSVSLKKTPLLSRYSHVVSMVKGLMSVGSFAY